MVHRELDHECVLFRDGELPLALIMWYEVMECCHDKITDAIAVVVYVTDEKYLEVVEMLQKRFWAEKSLPPITINIVTALNDNDIVEIEGTFSRV